MRANNNWGENAKLARTTSRPTDMVNYYSALSDVYVTKETDGLTFCGFRRKIHYVLHVLLAHIFMNR